MEELKDIQGLDQISNWPLAIGWWIVIFIICAVLIVAIKLLYDRYIYKKSWQHGSYIVLQQIEDQLDVNNDKQILHRLAIEIRRIGMLTSAREACAGLIGKQWLQWLQAKDPHHFNWPSEGQVLVQYQYMPNTNSYDKLQLQSLINAAKLWVRKC